MAKHEDLPVPVFSSLEPVYGDGSQLDEAKLRFDVLKSKFVEVFGQAPDIFARSPGREHGCSSFYCMMTKQRRFFVAWMID